MNPSPRQLRMFALLAESLSFSRTAEELHLTQPTLSKLMRELEDGMGVRLFERTTRTVSLTRDGQALLPVARRVVDQFDGGARELEQMVRNRSNRIAIAALPTLASQLLPRLLAEFRQAEPGARIAVHDMIAHEALRMLDERRVDMALTGVTGVAADFCCTTLFEEPFVLLHSASFGPADGLWSLQALCAVPIISMPHGTGTRDLLEAFFAAAGRPFRPDFDLRHLHSIAHFARAGCGIALLPESAARLLCFDELRISRLDGAPRRAVGIVTRRDADMPALAGRVMQRLRMMCARPALPAQHLPAAFTPPQAAPADRSR